MTAAVATIVANHTGITVSDLDRAAAFFRDVLGFTVSKTMECQGEIYEKLTGVDGAAMKVARVAAGGHTIELVQYLRPEGRDLRDQRPHDLGSMHLAFNVDDLDRIVEAAERSGGVALGPVQTVLDGPRSRLRAVYTKDVDGIVIELLELTRRDDEPKA